MRPEWTIPKLYTSKTYHFTGQSRATKLRIVIGIAKEIIRITPDLRSMSSLSFERRHLSIAPPCSQKTS